MTSTPPTSADIRRQFIDFFVKKHGHAFVPSSPVVPQDDPTLLFTNAGMNQFKPYFLGTAKAPAEWHGRVANTQKCIRAGGKHNDLDDVGRSRRHHTFFEMLGNWSFGDYFKQGAIEMAWELLTQVWKLDPTRLHVSCYEGSASVPRDEQAADIWRVVANWEQYGRKSDDHIHYFGKDNFWEMGDTGPCGPCTEIYIDRRPQAEIEADLKAGKRSPVNGEDPRVMEIWNNVFIQYNRDAAGKLTTLPAQHVDTGMGLERICQVLQGKDDNYGTDLFTPIFNSISEISNLKYTSTFPPTNAADPELEAANPQLRIDIAFRVIADHLRCLVFALTDGAVPSNEGRGYVLRRILRRAVRYGRQQLNLTDPFFYKLVPVVVETMGGMFPELKKNPQHVVDIIKDEEISFGKTLDRGIALFDESVGNVLLQQYGRYRGWKDGGVKRLNNKTFLEFEDNTAVDIENAIIELRDEGRKIDSISADDAFKLYDTYGFPIDLTRIMAEERGMTVDLAGYEKLMEKAREVSKGVDKAAGNPVYDLPPGVLDELHKLNIHPTDDSFKYKHGPARATLRAIWNGKNLDETAEGSGPGEAVALILDKTNFYAEMGGQVGDTGELRNDHGIIFNVEAARAVGPFVLHIGHVKAGKLTAGDGITSTVFKNRLLTEKNHTSTHLANWALRETLGDHVQQKGSLVDPEKLRFDFIHQKSMADDEIASVEMLVNGCIGQKLRVYAENAPQELALKIHGLRAVFGEKYPPMVRVVSIGVPVADLLKNPANPEWKQFSIEFCGGTHLISSDHAEHFVITSEESVSKGIRRIVALTGGAAREAATQADVIQSLLASSQSSAEAALPAQIAALQKAITEPHTPLLARRRAQAAIAELQDRHKKWQKAQDSSLKSQDSGFDPASLLTQAESVNGIALIVATVPEANADALRGTWDWLKRKHPEQNIAVLLASEFVETDKEGNKLPPKVNLLAAVGDPHINKLKAGDWIKAVSADCGRHRRRAAAACHGGGQGCVEAACGARRSEKLCQGKTCVTDSVVK